MGKVLRKCSAQRLFLFADYLSKVGDFQHVLIAPSLTEGFSALHRFHEEFGWRWRNFLFGQVKPEKLQKSLGAGNGVLEFPLRFVDFDGTAQSIASFASRPSHKFIWVESAR